MRIWGALLFTLILVGGPAFAEMTPEEVRNQINGLLAERRLENDRRLDNIEKLILEKEKARDGEQRAIIDHMEGNVRFFSAAIANLKDAIVTSGTSSKEATANAFLSAKEALDKAAVATEKRFDAVNEFRGQLKDQQQMLLPRAEAEAKIKSLGEMMASLAARVDQINGRTQGADATWISLSGACGLLIGAAGVGAAFIRRGNHDHDPVVERMVAETELSRIRAAISAEILALSSRLARVEKS